MTLSFLPDLLLLLLCLACHLPLALQGLALHDSDQWIYPVASTFLGSGETPWAFPFDQGYGGMGYSWLRVPFVGALQAMFGISWFRAETLFSYGVTPVFLYVGARVLGAAYFKGNAAWAVAIVAAAGLPFWAHLAGIDCYGAFLGFSFLLLASRAGKTYFLREGSPKTQFFTGVAAGFAVFLFRGALIFVATLLIPWERLGGFFKSWARSRGIWKTAFLGFLLLLLAFAFLAIHGSEIGHWNGKAIKLHALPNLRIAFVLAALAFLRFEGALVFPNRREAWNRAGTFALGACIGFLPEILYRVENQGRILNWISSSEEQRVETWRALQTAIREMWLGYDANRILGSPFSFAMVLLGVLALIALVERARRDEKFLAPLASLVLALIAYFSVHVSSPGPPRYFYPAYPALLLGIGVLWEKMATTRAGTLAATLLLGASIAFMAGEKWGLVARARSQGAEESILATKEFFTASKLEETLGKRGSSAKFPLVVLSDDYWKAGLRHTVGSEGALLFYPEQHPWHPPRVRTIFAERSLVGVMLTRLQEADPDPAVFRREGRVFLLYPLGRRENERFYAGIESKTGSKP